MKLRLIFTTITMVLLTTFIITPFVSADSTLDVVAWANPENVVDGQDVMVYIQATNNTGADVTLTVYAIDNEFFQFASGTVLVNNDTTLIEYQYTVNFNQNDSISIPIQINHDGTGGNAVVSYADQVYLYKTFPDISVQFNVIPDKTTINSGEEVSFRIYCENMGNTQMKDFYVRVNGEDHQYFDLAPNEYQDVFYEYTYTKDTTVTFGYAFSYEENGNWEWYVVDPAEQIKITILAADNDSHDNKAEATQAPSDDMIADMQNDSQDEDEEQPIEEQIENEKLDEQSVADEESSNNQITNLSIILIILAVIVIILLSTVIILFIRKKQ